MAVVVQSMVDARTAGVMFTRSPTTGDRSVVTIEGAWGLGSAVVGGEVTPDRWVLGKITGEISVREISDKHIEHGRAAGGGVEAVAVAERAAPRALPVATRELRAAAAGRAPGRAPLRLRRRTSSGPSTRSGASAAAAEPAGDGVVGEGRRARGARRSRSADRT